VVTGDEELLVERAVARLVAAAGGDAAAGAREVSAGALAPGELASVAAPSLFDAVPVVVVRDAQDASKEVADELAALAADPPPDVALVITHAGGAKGKALLGKLTASGAQVAQYPKITRIADRMTFIREEFRAAGRRIDDGGVRALIDALGSGLREIASACAQLAADTTGVIDQPSVARYYRGRAEAGGFAVADRAVEGKLAEALEHLRWALAVGVSPVLITSALAQGVRLIGRVGAAPRSRPAAALAAELGAPPWRIDKVRQQLRGWGPEGIARALAAVAEADAQVKGEGANPGYALEVAVRTIVACRTGR
jgi:DNA polymerase-3 subunit delta